MVERHLVLASGSPARLRLLRDAGFDPTVVVSGVEEDGGDVADPESLVTMLAGRKATEVAERLDNGAGAGPTGHAVVVGCDSMLEFGGRAHGKPVSDDEARAWLTSLRGGSAVLWTGHCVIDQAGGRRALGAARTTVRFGRTTDAELDAYLATGEARAVAGGFTLDGRSGPFVDGVDGDPGNVIGLSLPLLRSLLAELDIAITDLWAAPQP